MVADRRLYVWVWLSLTGEIRAREKFRGIIHIKFREKNLSDKGQAVGPQSSSDLLLLLAVTTL